MTRAPRLPAATTSALLAIALSLAGCQTQQIQKMSTPKNLGDIPVLGLPIEPGPAAKLGYAVGWVASFGEKDGRKDRINTMGHVRALGDLLVFVERRRDHVVALDIRSGEHRWTRSVGEKFQPLYAPVRSGDTIYVNTESRLHSIDAITGYERNTVELHTPVAADPAVLDNYLVFSGLDGNVVFFNMRTGYPTWQYKLPSSIRTHPVIFGKSAFAVDSQGKYAMLSVERREKAWSGHTWGPVLVDPVQFKDTLVVPCTDGTLYGINRSTGEDMWKYADMQSQLGAPPFVITNGSLIVLTIPGEGLRILSGVSGTEVARIATPARPVLATVDGKLLLQDLEKSELILMEMPSGRELARVAAMPLKEVVPLPDAGLILVGKDGQLMRLNPKKQ